MSAASLEILASSNGFQAKHNITYITEILHEGNFTEFLRIKEDNQWVDCIDKEKIYILENLENFIIQINVGK